MTKEVLVQVSGMQYEVDSENPTVLVAAGTYYLKNGKHYILYDEIDDDGQVSKNVIKISEQAVEVIRKGVVASHMVFEKGKENLTYYDVPYGSILMSIYTSKIQFVEKSSSRMELEIEYRLSVDGNYLSDCKIDITVTAQL